MNAVRTVSLRNVYSLNSNFLNGGIMKRVLLLLIFVGLLFFGIHGLFGEIREYREGEEEYEELEQFVVKIPKMENDVLGTSENEGIVVENLASEVLEVNFDSLTNVNSDCVAWVSIPGTNINYPVVNGIDNQYYVTHTFRKKANKSGAIFLDMRNSSDFSDLNTVLYGHNLKNSKMFSDLKRFLNQSYFNRNHEIVIYMPDKEYHYEIFAVYKTMEDDNTYRVKFTEDGFKEHLQSICQKAEVLKEQDDMNMIITLSTCTNDAEGESIVVIGRLIEVQEENVEEQ
jgi:sortase B